MDGLSSRDIRNYALSTITAIQPSDSVADLTDVSFFIWMKFQPKTKFHLPPWDLHTFSLNTLI